MTPNSSTSTLADTAAETTIAEPAGATTRSEPAPESAKLHTVRGLNGWTLYCIEDGDESDGIAALERFGDNGPADMLVADWHLHDSEARALTVTLRGGSSFSLEFVDEIHVSLAAAALKQLGSWGVDAFVLE
jgi:hypothetical protein